jgi:hypothetical protein
LTPGLFLTTTALVLSIGPLATASAEVEDIGTLPAPIADGYVEANPASWPSDFDAGPIPSAIVDFRPVDALLDSAWPDPDEAEPGAIFSRTFLYPRILHGGNLVAYSNLDSPSEHRMRAKKKPNCSSDLVNIARCNFYDADLLLLSGESRNNDSNQTQPGQNPPAMNNQTPGSMRSVSPLDGLIGAGCGNSALACYELLFPAYGDTPPAVVSSDQTETSVGVAPGPSSVDTPWTPPDPGPFPASAPEAPAPVMVLIGFGFLALARWKSRLRAIRWLPTPFRAAKAES